MAHGRMGRKREISSDYNWLRIQDMDRELNSKELVRGVFESVDLPRLPFIPWIFSHAAKLEQITLRNMYNDPTQYSKCLQNTRKLYGYDAIISGFDSSLEAEMCGCPINWRDDFKTPDVEPRPDFNFSSLKDINVENAVKTGRFGTAFESLRRINMVSGKNIALATIVTGPLTVATVLTGRNLIQDFSENREQALKTVEAAAAFILKVIQIYAQLQPDIIAVADRLISTFPVAYLERLPSILSPIINTIRFYNAYPVLLPGNIPPENLAEIIKIGFDGIVASEIDSNTWRQIKNGKNCILGKAIPSRLFTSGKKELQEYLESYLKTGIEPGTFLTTDWEVPPETPPENLHLVMDMIARH
jgi:uroporphyrinogen-III decarboxylase